MYRDKLEKIRKEKHITSKEWADVSGVSIDTIARIIRPENPEKDSPRVNTLESLCKVLGVELWEIFHAGDHNLADLQAEIASLKSERDALVSENEALRNKVDELRDNVNTLKNEIIYIHHYYITQKTNG